MDKKCCTCGVTKDLMNFSKNKNSKDGYKEYCKSCASIKNREYRNKYKDKINSKNREWYNKSKLKKNERTQQELNQGNKTCSVCEKVKEIRDFYERGNGGFYSYCKECHTKKTKIYVDENREKVLARKKAYYIKTRDYQLSYFKKYSKINSKRNVERAIKWANANRDRVREYSIAASHRRRAKLKNVDFTFNRDEWNYCKNYFKNSSGYVLCAYCDKEMINATQEHFIPVHKGGNHTKHNILPICQNCNSQKSAQDFYQWYPTTSFYKKENVEKIEKYFEHLLSK